MIFQQGQTVVFFGDSLTHRTGVIENPNINRRYPVDYFGSYVDILLKKILIHYPGLDLNVWNKGVGGDTTEKLLNRVESDVIDMGADWVVLFIGANDSKRFSPEEFKANLTSLLSIFRENDVRVVHLTAPRALSDPNNRNTVFERYDEMIKALSIEFQTLLVDLGPAFERILEHNASDATPIALQNDGCHFSEMGNMLLADLVFDVLTLSPDMDFWDAE